MIEALRKLRLENHFPPLQRGNVWKRSNFFLPKVLTNHTSQLMKAKRYSV